MVPWESRVCFVQTADTIRANYFLGYKISWTLKITNFRGKNSRLYRQLTEILQHVDVACGDKMCDLFEYSSAVQRHPIYKEREPDND